MPRSFHSMFVVVLDGKTNNGILLSSPSTSSRSEVIPSSGLLMSALYIFQTQIFSIKANLALYVGESNFETTILTGLVIINHIPLILHILCAFTFSHPLTDKNFLG